MEFSRVFTVVGKARPTGAGVPGGEDDADTASAELSEEVADGFAVGEGDGLFRFTIGGGDGLGDIVLFEDPVQPVEVGFIVAEGDVEIGDEGWTAAGGEVDVLGWVAEGDGVLDVEVGFRNAAGAIARVLRVCSVVN